VVIFQEVLANQRKSQVFRPYPGYPGTDFKVARSKRVTRNARTQIIRTVTSRIGFFALRDIVTLKKNPQSVW
jgi:hypothetical protein